jgi:hypothetical protein
MSRIYIGSKIAAIDSVKKEFPDRILVLSDNPEIQSKNYSVFFDSKKIFLYDNPNIEKLKIIQSQINANKGTHFLFYDDDSFDGRNSLIQSVKKTNQIFDYSYPLFGDFAGLRRSINSYINTTNKSIDANCYEWLNKNCPTVKVKSKATGSKKESICNDIDLLNKEFEKILSINQKITTSDLENSSFVTDADIFEFIEYVMNNNLEESFSLADKLINSIGEQALLLILLSQLIFILEVVGCKENKIFSIDKIVEILEKRDLLGINFDENWKETKYTVKSQNPIRVKIEMSKLRHNSEKISSMISNVIDSISHLRNNGRVEQSMFLLLNKLLFV